MAFLNTFQYTELFVLKWMLMCFIMLFSIAYLWRRRTDNFPPGPRGYPILGSLHLLTAKAHRQLSNLCRTYGDVFSLTLGEETVVVVSSSEGILEGLSEKGEATANRPSCLFYNTAYNNNRQGGISTADYTEKTVIKKAFLFSCWQGERDCDMEFKITAEIMSFICKILESNTSTSVNPSDLLFRSCLSLMLWITFGKRYDQTDANFSEILLTYKIRSASRAFQLCDFLPLLQLFNHRKIKAVEQRTMMQLQYQRDLINQHKDLYNPECIRDLLDQALGCMEENEDMGSLHGDDLNYMLLDLTGMGSEVNAVLLSWLLGFMALHQDIQSRVQQEIQSVVGDQRLPYYSDQDSLPYTVAAILEAQRMSSVLPFLLPHAAAGNTILQGYNIPEGTWLLFNVWSLHHDTRYWERPMEYIPSRFLDEENRVCLPPHFLPYGIGPRSCAGEALSEMHLFLFFTHVMHQLSVELDSDVTDIVQDAEYDSLLRPKPFKLHFTAKDPKVIHLLDFLNTVD